MPDEQRGYFEDGKITLGEYQEAYGHFLTCLDEAGVADAWNEVGRDEVTGLIEYSITVYEEGFDMPGSRVGECYKRWWLDTEATFQTSDPTVLAGQPAEQMQFFDEAIRPCLEHIGVEIPDDLEFLDENWNALNDEAVRAIQDGRCE